MYFSTRHIPALRSMPLAQRLQAMQAASRLLTVPEKTLLNGIKLVLLIPAFVLLIAVENNWQNLIWALLLFCCFSWVIKPIQYALSEKYLPQVIKDDP